jgi:hypothetical protein
MGVNAQIEVPAFTAGQVLTAAEMTQINTGIPVFATTVTRDAAFGGAGEKVLAQGQMAFIEATNATQFYDGAAWQTLGGGLTLVKSQVVGSAVASVQVTSAFSATYDNYMIMYNNGSSSTTIDLFMIVGATTSGYYWNIIGNTWSATASNAGSTTGSSWSYVGATDSTNGTNMALRVLSPFLAKRTVVDTEYVASTGGYKMTGMLNNTTSYTSFTITPNSGTLTGGTIRVYGYNI